MEKRLHRIANEIKWRLRKNKKLLCSKAEMHRFQFDSCGMRHAHI